MRLLSCGKKTSAKRSNTEEARSANILFECDRNSEIVQRNCEVGKTRIVSGYRTGKEQTLVQRNYFSNSKTSGGCCS